MQWPWSPHRNDCETENMARLRVWYRIVRILSWANIAISLLLLLLSVIYGWLSVGLIVVLTSPLLHHTLARFLEDIDACAQDVVVYRGKPKFKHRI